MSVIEIVTVVLCVIYFGFEFMQLCIKDRYRPKNGSKTYYWFYWENRQARSLSTAIDVAKIILVGAIMICQFYIFL